MSSSGMWHRVGLLRTDVSEERTESVASIFKAEIINELGKTLPVTSD
jgi:hypothetical protein